jgi:hypothetical protein
VHSGVVAGQQGSHVLLNELKHAGGGGASPSTVGASLKPSQTTSELQAAVVPASIRNDVPSQ